MAQNMHRQQVVSEEQTAMMAKVPTQLEVSSSGEARFILGFFITSELFLLVFGVISRPKLKRVLEMDNSIKIRTRWKLGRELKTCYFSLQKYEKKNN